MSENTVDANTDNQNEMSEAVFDQPVTPGAKLAQAREQAELTVKAVASELRLTVKNVKFIEADDFDQLPSEPFVLGYLRAYARLLELDPQAVVDGYKEYRQALRATGQHLALVIDDQLIESAQDKVQVDTTEAAPAKGVSPLWLAVGLLVLWCVAVFLMGDNVEGGDSVGVDNDHVDVANVSLQQTEPVAAENVLDSALLDASTAAVAVDAEVLENNSFAADDFQSVTETQTAEEIVGDEDAVPVLPGLDQLLLTFTDECWLEVTDARGDVLNTDLYQSGERVTLQGESPFEIKVGNVRAVSVKMNGVDVELVPDGQRKTLRVKVSAPDAVEMLKKR